MEMKLNANGIQTRQTDSFNQTTLEFEDIHGLTQRWLKVMKNVLTMTS